MVGIDNILSIRLKGLHFMGIREAPPPPPDERPFIRVAKIRPGTAYQFWVLSQRLHGYETHFDGIKTVPHIDVMGGCPLCHSGSSKRWAGFLAVMTVNTRATFLLAVTPGAYNNSPELQHNDGRLRGLWLSAKRLGDHTKSGLQVSLSNPPEGEPRPKSFPLINVPGAVSRLWGVDVELGEGSLAGAKQACD